MKKNSFLVSVRSKINSVCFHLKMKLRLTCKDLRIFLKDLTLKFVTCIKKLNFNNNNLTLCKKQIIIYKLWIRKENNMK